MMTNIDFLKAVLNKQFELVGCNKTTEEVINMGAEQQLEFWNSYKITQEQHNEWRKYFMELAPENEEFKVYLANLFSRFYISQMPCKMFSICSVIAFSILSVSI